MCIANINGLINDNAHRPDYFVESWNICAIVLNKS